MKRFSIRFKITLWFTAALLLVAVFSFLIVFTVSNQILQKTIKDNLIETVSHNVDEIEYIDSLAHIDLKNETDHFIHYKNGFLVVDDDFLDQVNEVYTALYYTDGSLMYGENPIAKDIAAMRFSDSEIQTQKVNGLRYYVFDRRLIAAGTEGLWLRGVVSEEQGAQQMTNITRLSLIFLPLFVLIASVGGYLIARRMLRPIQQISNAAKQIGDSNDLKKRIKLNTQSKDELHRLADSFNEMFEHLDEAFEAERQFTSDASHELRTPMSVIMAQCEYSLEQPRSAEEYEDALRVINRQGKRMSKLIGDMLDFTRLENGSERYSTEKIALAELVTSICEDMALIGDHNITLCYKAATDIYCMGNRELLSRLLINLISNAYRYGKENGHIQVTLAQNADSITLSVADDGIGIAPEAQTKIFRRFYQANNARSGAGNGLGLSMAQKIAQFHKGTLTVESEPNVGSTFTFTLPAIS